MDFKAFVALRKAHTLKRISMSEIKGKEYANGDDRLANFKRQADSLGVSAEVVLQVYMNKHIDAINNYVKRGCEDTGSESIVGRIYDVQNYCDLLLGLIEESKEIRGVKEGETSFGITVGSSGEHKKKGVFNAF